jgi:hypothetical protein
MIVELLKDPPQEPAAAGGAERRRSRRHAVTLPATVTPADEAFGIAPIDVRVKDISLHGAGLRLDGPLATGAVFLLDIGAGPLKLHARVRVKNARLRKDGAWDIGTEFFAG